LRFGLTSVVLSAQRAIVLAACTLLPSPASLAQPAPTGNVVGMIRFTGDVPPPKAIMTTDGGTIHHQDLVVDAKSKGLRYVVAILEDAPPQPKVKNAAPVLVDQRDMIFLPRVVAVQHGQATRFENNDLCNHSVMAASIVPANQLNVIAAPNQPVIHVFEPQKTPVLIGCSLHNWMRAWVFVVPHPWFAVSDAQGRFRLENVPPGKYTLLLVHPDTNRRERQTVEVVAGKNCELNLEWTR